MRNVSSSTCDNPWPHRWAVALCCATFPLIWVGALVTTYDAGMAVPDWPSTYGYNLFLYPWQTWLFGPFELFIEHKHRLLGALAGMLTTAFLLAVWRADRSRTMRVLAAAAFVGVVAQGALGGARVLMDERLLAMVHGITGPIFFGYTALLATITSRRWREAPAMKADVDRGTLAALLLTVVLVVVQLVFGAMLRHVPVGADVQWFRAAVVFHVFTAIVIAIHVLTLGWRVLARQRQAWLVRPMHGLILLVAAQIVLGASTWVVKYAWPSLFSDFNFAAGYTVTANSLLQSMIVTAHVAVGSLILATSVVLAARAARLANWKAAKVPFDLRARELAV